MAPVAVLEEHQQVIMLLSAGPRPHSIYLKTNGFQPRGPAQKFTFSHEGCRKLQNRERHAGPEAKKNGLLASIGIDILWFATPSERERKFCTCFKIIKINRRFL